MATSAKFTPNQAVLNNLNNKVNANLLRLAFDIAAKTRANAPYRTGALRNSVRVTDDKPGEVTIKAGGQTSNKSIPYARIHEFGGWTGRGHKTYISAKHYMQRAADTVMSGDYIKKYFGNITK